jgi:hypothetical protein
VACLPILGERLEGSDDYEESRERQNHESVAAMRDAVTRSRDFNS